MTVQELQDALRNYTEDAVRNYREMEQADIQIGCKERAAKYKGICTGLKNALEFVEWYINEYGE